MALVELDAALTTLRAALTAPEALVRASATGRRRGVPAPDLAALPDRVEVRPVALRGVLHLQVTERTGPVVRVRNLAVDDDAALDALLALPFTTWHAETTTEVLQVRVTKKGLATVGLTPTSSSTPLRDDQGPGPRSSTNDPANDRAKQHLLDPDDPLFTVLGAGGDKRRQVDAFLRQLRAALPADLANDRPLRVVDLGCGNAYLTLAAQRWLSARPHGAVTVGVELRDDLVARSTARAADAGVDGLSFVAGTIEGADPTAALGGAPDVVLALHACDTATDDALARAVAWGSPVVLAAPCCHRDVQRQLVAAGAGTARSTLPAAQAVLVGSPILRERFADVLTDALRSLALRSSGYGVDVVEFVDSRHTPRNALVRAVRPVRPLSAAERQAAATDLAELAGAWGVTPVLATRLG